MNSSTIAEKYRPKTLEDVCGHEKIKNRIASLKAKEAIGGKAYWISGNSGTGKTTIARIIASYMATTLFISEVDAGEISLDFLREYRNDMETYGWLEDEKRGKALIINEAHGLRADAIKKLLVMLESIPSHCVVIFTTTREAQDDFFDDKIDAFPLLSRCIELRLSQRDLTVEFSARVKQIAESEGMDGLPIERYQQLARDKRNNMRAMLMTVESGEMMAISLLEQKMMEKEVTK